MRSTGSLRVLLVGLLAALWLARPAAAFSTEDLTQLASRMSPQDVGRFLHTVQQKYPTLGAELVAQIEAVHPQLLPDVEAAVKHDTPAAYDALDRGFRDATTDGERVAVLTDVLMNYPQARQVALDTIDAHYRGVYATVLQFIADHYPEVVIDLARAWSDAGGGA